MGVVYRATDRVLQREVALKLLLAGKDADERDVERFVTEARAAAKLEHPGIVPIFEIGQSEGHYFIAMALMREGSLADRVKNCGSLSPWEAAEIIQKVAEAVAFAHAKHIIHRDLKPANVLVGADGEPRVSDFGLAKHFESNSELTQYGAVLGTPSYMPPEQAKGMTDAIDARSDVYSLGAKHARSVSDGGPSPSAHEPLG